MADDVISRIPLLVRKVGILLFGLILCACQRSDASRAHRERLSIQKDLANSWSLIPYRSFKLLARASARQPAPPEVEALWARLEGLRTADEAGTVGSAIQAGALLVEARGLLKTRDEDDFPTLGSRVRREALPAWYDNGADHACMGLLLYLARRGGVAGVPQSFLLYEASRATPSTAWPVDLRALASLQRAMAYQEAKAHFAAEEAYDAYLREVEGLRAPEGWLARPADARAYLDGLRGVGHVGRGLNRLDLGREPAADQDFQEGLRCFDSALPDSELTQWLAALVHARAGRGAEAGARLQRLAGSPGLDEAGRKAIQEAAAGLASASRPGALLASPRMMWHVLRAWEARTQAASKTLATLGLAGDRAPLQCHLAWFERIHSHLGPKAAEGWLQRMRGMMASQSSVPAAGDGR